MPSAAAVRCHYDILGIDKTADDTTIKKAYRKMALTWHPDKNQDRKEEAEEKFKEICNAYEVLSDPHERSWYDSHREQILRSGSRHQAGDTGGTGWTGGQKPDDEPDLFSYFNANAFSGYNDGPRGFYTVYGDLFFKMGQQEQRAYEQREDRQQDTIRPPPFGNASAPWPVVSAFYDYWSTFASYKDFAWADEYHLGQAPNRRYRRAMEEENKKTRAKARKEFNDEVRELVAFLKKRDRRVLEHRRAEAERIEREKKELEERRRREKEEKRARAAAFQEADWVLENERRAHAQFEKEWFEGIAASSSEDGEASGAEEGDEGEGGGLPDNYCVACDKAFKSAQQLANHERSKKHLDQVRALKRAMRNEDALFAELGLGPDPASGPTLEELEREDSAPQGLAGGTSGEGARDMGPEAPDRRSKKSKKKEKERKKFQQQGGPAAAPTRGRVASSESESEEDAAAGAGASKGPGPGPGVKGKRKGPSVPKSVSASDPESGEDGDGDDGLDEDEMMRRLLGMKIKKEGTGEAAGAAAAEEEDGSEKEESGSKASEDSEDVEESEDDEDPMAEMLRRAAAAKPSASGVPAPSKKGGSGRKNVPSQSGAAPAPSAPAPLMGISSDDDEDWRRGAGAKGKGKKKGGAAAGAAKGSAASGGGLGEKVAGAAQAQAPPPPPLEAQAPAKGKQKKKKEREDESTAALRCQVCKALFESRTKLFAHIKATGHAALKH